MYVAEHLDLVTNVKDGFTNELTRLSGLLETVGQQADRLSPIYIHVSVRDRELRKLERRMARVQAMEATGIVTGTGRMPAGTDLSATDILEQHSHTLEQSLSSVFEENLRDIQQAVKPPETEVTAPHSIANVNHLAVANANLVNVASAQGSAGSAMAIPSEVVDSIASAARAGVTDGGRPSPSARVLSREELSGLSDALGVHIPSRALAHRDASPANLIRGGTPLTGITPADVSDIIPPQALMRAFDFGELQARLPPGLKELGTPRGMMGQPLDAIAKHADGIADVDDMLTQLVDNQTLQWERFKQAFFDIRIGMTQFYDFLAALMPLMFVFMGAIPAVIAGLGGLAVAAAGAATVLGSIAGLGLLGAAAQRAGGDRPGFEDIRDAFEGVLDDFWQAFRPVAEDLAPTFDRGLGGLSRLFDELATRAELLPEMTHHAEAFGTFMVDLIAGTFEQLILFTDAARPIFSMIAEGLQQRDVIRGFAGALAIVLPRLSELTAIILNALPGIMRFSAGMLTMSTYIARTLTFITSLVTTLFSLVPGIDDGNRALGMFVGTMFTMMSATFLATKVAALFQSKLVKLAMTKLMAVKWSNLLTLSFYKQASGATIASKATWGLTASVAALKKVVAGLLAMTGVGLILVGLGAAVSHLAGEFTGLDDSITNATDSLREFERQERGMRSEAHMDYLGTETEIYVDVTEENTYNIDGDLDPRTHDRMSDFSSTGFTDNF